MSIVPFDGEDHGFRPGTEVEGSVNYLLIGVALLFVLLVAVLGMATWSEGQNRLPANNIPRPRVLEAPAPVSPDVGSP